MTAKEQEELREYAIEKITQLKIKAEFDDRKRGKKRYVPLVIVYSDLIKILKEVNKL